MASQLPLSTMPLAPARAGRAGGWPRWWPLAFVTLAALAVRAMAVGNPVLDFDEQLYLLVGDGLRHGLLPYVDLWDRKPIGLFLWYAAVRSLGGGGIVQYQLAAAGCVAAVALLIWWMARRAVGNAGAVTAAVAYVLFLEPLYGRGGQAGVLYNGLVALAGAAAYRANDTADPRRIARLGLAALAAIGVAIQFKYTVLVEGVFFGCYFLARLAACGAGRGRLAAAGLAMVALALAPTLAAVGWYARAGQLGPFVQANFTSIFLRERFPPATRAFDWWLVGAVGAPLLLLGGLGAARLLRARGDGRGWDRALLLGWTGAALAGFAMLGDFYAFYFIPVLPPLLVLVAAGLPLGGSRVAPFGWVLLAWPLMCAAPVVGQAGAMRERTDRLVAAVDGQLGGRRLLYVYDGPTILYYLTGTRSPSRFVFPDHLTNPIERHALGVDPVAEERRLLAARPPVIVTADRSIVERVDARTQALVRAALARRYRLAASVRVDRLYHVWALVPERAAPVPVPAALVQ